MKAILELPSRSYWIQVLNDLAEFEPPFSLQSYPCLIWDTRGSRSESEMQAFAAIVIASGCRYAVCGGIECERWHDAFDMAFLAQNLSYVDSEEQFVMTSLHPGEAPDEVAFFLVMNTSFDHHDFTKLLVVQLGADWSTEQALTDGVRAHATVPDGEDDEDEDEEAWSGGAA